MVRFAKANQEHFAYKFMVSAGNSESTPRRSATMNESPVAALVHASEVTALPRFTRFRRRSVGHIIKGVPHAVFYLWSCNSRCDLISWQSCGAFERRSQKSARLAAKAKPCHDRRINSITLKCLAFARKHRKKGLGQKRSGC